jgi:hypothetical protein
VQPSNIHELNSFLNSNHYYNASNGEQVVERRKVNSNGVANLIARKNLHSNNAGGPVASLEKQNDYISNGPIQHGVSYIIAI